MDDSRSRRKGFIVRELQWGVLNDETQLKAFPSIKAFCRIDSRTFATSDGRYVTIWTPSTTITTINLRAISLCYMHQINHIVAFAQKSIELFFISMRSPYCVTKHPFPFSNKVITVMHFFEKSSILVTAGQGLMFTRVIIPTIFKTSSPIPEMLKFEKVDEIYQDQLFVSYHSPVFVDSKEIVIVYFDSEVKFHLLDGTCIQQFSQITMSPISCVNFYDQKNILVVGDQEGYTSIIPFQCKDPFHHGAHPEAGGLIHSYRPEICHLLYSQIFEEDFLITVGLNCQITVFSLVAEKAIQKVKINSIRPQLVHYIEPHFFIFSPKEIVSFTVNIFTKHFASLSADSVYLNRRPSLKTAARLLCITGDSIVSLFSPKNAKLLFSVSAVDYQHDIKNVIYPRDAVFSNFSAKPISSSPIKSDQSSVQFQFQTLNQKQPENQFKTTNEDSAASLNLSASKSEDIKTNSNNMRDFGFFRMGDDKLLMIDFNVQVDMKKIKKSNLFTSMTFMDSKYLSNKTFDWNNESHFVSLLRIETSRYPSSIMGVCKSGVCQILSLISHHSKTPIIETFSLGYGRVICAAFSSVHKYVIFSCLEHSIIYDLDNHKIVLDVDRTYFRSLLFINDHSIACGCSNGSLEVRNFPQMTIQATSQKYEVYHSGHGYRRDIKQELEEYDRMLDIDFSINSIDYCNMRNSLLTMSPNGEIFVWSIDCFPIFHILLDFTPTAACFLNGYGSLVISSLKTLFTIDWKYLFNEKLTPQNTLLDDFDLRDDKFDLQKFSESRLEHAEDLEFLVKQKQTPSHKFTRVLGQDNLESLTPLLDRNQSKLNFRPFRIRRNTSLEAADAPHFFDDLLVEQDEIPKNYFYRQEECLDPKPKRRKIQKPVNFVSRPLGQSRQSPKPQNNSDNQEKAQTKKTSKNDKNKTSEIKVKRKNKRECEIEKLPTSSKAAKSSGKIASSNNSKKKKKQTSNPKSAKVTKNIKVKKVSKLSKGSNLSLRRESAQSVASSISQNIDNSGEVSYIKSFNEEENENFGHKLNNTPSQSQNKSRSMMNAQNDDEDQVSIGNEEGDTNNEVENLNSIELQDKSNYRNNYQLQKENANNVNGENESNENGENENNVNDENENNGNGEDRDDVNDEFANNDESKINDENENRNENVFDFESDEIIKKGQTNENTYIDASKIANVSCQTNFESNSEKIEKQKKQPLKSKAFKREVRLTKKIAASTKNINKGVSLLNSNSKKISNAKKRAPITSKSAPKCEKEEPYEKSVIEIHMAPITEMSELGKWKLLSAIKNSSQSPRNKEKYEVKEPDSKYVMHPRNRNNRNSINKTGENENDSNYELVSGANDSLPFKSPLLYVQNYGEGYDSNDEENLSEPYVIEDLHDPRMKFYTDAKLKYLKMQQTE